MSSKHIEEDGLTTTDPLSTSTLTITLASTDTPAVPITEGGSITVLRSEGKSWNWYNSQKILDGINMYQFSVINSDYYAIKVSLGDNQAGTFVAKVTQQNTGKTIVDVLPPAGTTFKNVPQSTMMTYEVLSEDIVSIVGHILDWMASEWLCGGCADYTCPISSRNPARITPPNQSILVEEEEEEE